jgi:hypothetical protein
MKYKIESGPYSGKIVFLKRKDVINNMRYVIDAYTNEVLFVKESEISLDPVKPVRHKLKIKERISAYENIKKRIIKIKSINR